MLDCGNERILVIAPHADDEVLGCGGLIEKACRLKNKVKVVVAAVGNIQHQHQEMIITRNVRKQELKDAMNYLGCDDVEVMYDDKDALLNTVPKKELVSNQDHRVLNQASISALRPRPNKNIKLVALYEYPLIDWQQSKFWNIGGLYLDISKTVHIKIEAFKKHASQLREPHHLLSPESVLKWAEMRGLEAGCICAEKYYVLRSFLL